MSANPYYNEFPQHPLHNVPQVVLDEVRAYMRDCIRIKDLHTDFPDEIADALVAVAGRHVPAWEVGEETQLAEIRAHMMLLIKEAAVLQGSSDFANGYLTGLKVAAQVCGIPITSIMFATNPITLPEKNPS